MSGSGVELSYEREPIRYLVIGIVGNPYSGQVLKKEDFVVLFVQIISVELGG